MPYTTITETGKRNYTERFCFGERLSVEELSRLNISELAHYGASEVKAGNADILRFEVLGAEVAYVHESMRVYPDIMYYVLSTMDKPVTYGGPWPTHKTNELRALYPEATHPS
jgi:hypothetical protein